MNIDATIILWVQETFGPAARPFWEVITNLGDAVIVVVIVVLSFWLKGTRFGLQVGIVTIVGGLLKQMLKVLIMEPRPYYANEAIHAWRDSGEFGMPSGHSSNSVTLWGTLALLMNRRWLYPLAGALIFLIGLSRIYFGVHTPSQVLAGWLVGSIMVLGWLIYEQRMLNWLRKFSVWIQVGMAAGVALALLLFSAFVVPALEENFVVPQQWVERYHEAQTYEASLEGETIETFKEFELFESVGIDEIGLIFGILLLGIYALKWGGFENFTRREQIANVVVGFAALAILIPLMEVAEATILTELFYWILLPLILGLAVPAAARWRVKQLFFKHPNG